MTWPLPTPGEILATEFLEPMGLTQYRLAQAIHVPQTRIAAIVKDGRSITADTALRLARFFGTSVEFWMNLQGQYDADTARMELAEELESIEPFAAAA
ncbi:HigA family addiction module antitoxin [Acidovorax sp. SDU_ACID1]|uniref:HigA family addiction module antitoxin n=1 Tax=Acidovorax sp. SDU_ACID1 TaxID=3136632 RepID=UPI003873C29A